MTASTSVILVDTASQTPPYIVYFPYNPAVGRIITVRDNDGYASTGNSIVISSLSDAYFPNNQNTLFINQPFGFITFSVQPGGLYSILNTFAFPTGSASAFVNTLNTNTFAIQDQSGPVFNILTTLSNTLYFNSNVVGNVTNVQLSNAISNVESQFFNLINSQTITRQYLAVGTATSPDGTIQFSDNNGFQWYDASVSLGFANGGTDIAADSFGTFVACGDNTGASEFGFIQWSFDGKSWINSSSPSLDSTRLRSKVHYANGIWHAVGAGSNGQSILWGTDKKNWNSSLSAIVKTSSNIFRGIAYGNSTWVACGSNINGPQSLVWSSDGSNWNTNGSIPNNLSFYDVVYDGTNFITLANNGSITSIYYSITGKTWSVPVQTSATFGNESGYLAANRTIVLAVTPTYRKYSIDNGQSWTTITGFPSGIPRRPYYDGSIWWVGVSDAAENVYLSPTGNNDWTSNAITGLFPGGTPNSFVAINTSSNLNLQLISTVYGISESFTISSLQSDVIQLNTYSLDNTTNSNVLDITSYNPNALVYIENLSTNSIQTNELNLTNLNISTVAIDTLTVSNQILSDNLLVSSLFGNYGYIKDLYISTLYTTDILYSSTIIAENISALSVYISNLTVFDIDSDIIRANTISSYDLMVTAATISTVTVLDTLYSDIVSTNTVVLSTLQLVDPDGSLTDLYTSTNNLYFQGTPLIKNTVNPTYFPYKLIDNSGGTLPGSAGQFSIYTNVGLSINLNSATQLYVYYIDYSNTILSGFFNSVGVHCIIHIINDVLGTDHIYRIDSIILPENNTQYYIFNITSLSGQPENGVTYQIYNLYIDNIGIPPPVTPPSNLVTVFAPTNSVNGFNFTPANALISMPSYIVQSYGPTTTTSFKIQLNNTNYNSSRIPAIVGSIVYYNGTYVVANVKCGSISPTTGAYITIDSGVNAVTVSGLTLANFPGAVNDTSGGSGLAIYITLQFLN